MKIRLFITGAIILYSSLYVLFPSATIASELEATLVASDGSGEQQSFSTLSIDGDRLVATADNADDGIGAVYVYERNGIEWVQTATITASDADGLMQFGSGGVSLDGNRVIVGVPNRGSAYIYDLVDGLWVETKLTDSNIGRAVSLDGDRAIVGHWGRTGPESGSAFIYELINGSWVRTASLPGFGLSVSLDGDTAVVASRLAVPDQIGPNSLNQGVATVYEFRVGEWVETAILTTNDLTASFYGESISVSENQLMVGATGSTRSGDNNGTVYVYNRNDGTWGETTKLTASDRSAGDGFGHHVSLDGSRAIVSKSMSTRIGGALIPAAYVFELTGGQWTETQMLLGRGEISLDGDTAIVVSERLSREVHVYNLGSLNNCDYTKASLHDGYGFDAIANTDCPPLVNEIATDETLIVTDNAGGTNTTDVSTDAQPISSLVGNTPNDSTDETTSPSSGGGSFWLPILMFALAVRSQMRTLQKQN